MSAKRLLSRALRIVLALVGLLVILVGGVILFDTVFPSQRVTDFTNVSYVGSDGVTRHAYLARPAGPGPHPALLLIHEFYGLNRDITLKADRLAEEGYVVLAVDAYGGKTTRVVPRAILFVVSTPQARISANVDAGYRYLAALEAVDPQRLGAAGFCFGGTQVTLLGVRNPGLAAAAIFYGNGPITDPAALGSLGQNGPVLGIYGEKDQGIPLTEVEGFKRALAARGIEHRVIVYPGVGHAFVHYESIDLPGPAQDAWRVMVAFFAAALRPAG